MKNCTACNSDHVKEYYSITDLPLLLFPVDKDIRYNIKQENITSYYCENCNHIFTAPLSDKNSDLLYREYYRFYPYDNLESMNVHYRKPFEDFFGKVLLSNGIKGGQKKLLEIGCSSGKQLEFFERFDLVCNGIDPSPLNEDSSNKLISGFYHNYVFERKFDIIVSRFVLEHINNPIEFLKKVSSDLEDSGIVFLQVPNIMEFINNFIPSVLAHEHSQYFNAFSMAKLAEKSNFETVDILHLNSQSICIALRKRNVTETKVVIEKNNGSVFSDYIKKRNECAKSVAQFVNDNPKSVCFYGSGLVLFWLLYDLKLNNLRDCLVIDDNPKLDGKFMPQSDFLIKNFSLDLIKNFDKILLTLNPVYLNTVIRKIRDSGYRGKLYSISSNGISEIV